ncbi:glycosyltransferase family A protein [Christiangramia marina]|uniref:glycosyltransferase family A protein n=1 Tax=Christiangramia marina TaxID=409436 RepID=UPI003AA851CD
MREGFNPNKDKKNKDSPFKHQVIIPIYIPHQDDYFKDSFQILKICIQSLLDSSRPDNFISLISNGSCREVERYLEDLYLNGKVQEIITTPNIGKYNAVLKAVSGHDFPLITIGDADIYYKPNWQEETYKVFENFKKAGVVGLIPQFLSYQSHCENLLFDHAFSPYLKFGAVKEPEALREFYKSIGWKPNYPKDRLKYTLYLKQGDYEALVGSGHAVATYKRELFEGISLFNPFKMGGNSEAVFDKLAPVNGCYRFTSSRNMAFHLGNKLDKAFIERLNSKNKQAEGWMAFPELPRFPNPKFILPYFLKRKSVQLVLKSHKLRMLYLKQLGLPKAARKSF